MNPNSPHKGWHSRGYLPHLDVPHLVQGLTIRLYDAMPENLLRAWRQDLRHLAEDEAGRQERKMIEKYLDSGRGACWLARPDIAEIVRGSMEYGDKSRYDVLAWVVMPNHCHLLIRPIEPWGLPTIVESFKKWTGREANKALGRSGSFWYPDYFDRYMRNSEHLLRCVEYIHMNPVKAGLCAGPEAWPWSSFCDSGESRSFR